MMKRIVHILIFCLLAFGGYAQYPTQFLGTTGNRVEIRGQTKHDSLEFMPRFYGFPVLGAYSDTLGAWFYNMMDFTVYYRDTVLLGGHQWTKWSGGVTKIYGKAPVIIVGIDTATVDTLPGAQNLPTQGAVARGYIPINFTSGITVNQSGKNIYFADGGQKQFDSVLLSTQISFGTPAAMTCLGNSITVGLNTTIPSTQSYTPILAAYWGGLTRTNLAVSGTGAWHQIDTFNINTNAPDVNLVTWMAGFNDLRYSTATSPSVPNYLTVRKICNALNACFINHFAKNQLSAGATAANLTLYGAAWNKTYPARSVGGKAVNNGAYDNVHGDSLVFHFTDSTVYWTSIGTDSSYGANNYSESIQVYIDNVLVQVVNLNNQTDGVTVGSYDNKRSPIGFVYHGLNPSVQHTLKLVNNTALSYYMVVDQLGTLQDASVGRPFVVFDIPHMDSTGYAISPSGSSAQLTDSTNKSIDSTARSFIPKYAIFIAPTNQTYKAIFGVDLSFDHIHPDSLGHTEIAQIGEVTLPNVTNGLYTSPGTIYYDAAGFHGNYNGTIVNFGTTINAILANPTTPQSANFSITSFGRVGSTIFSGSNTGTTSTLPAICAYTGGSSTIKIYKSGTDNYHFSLDSNNMTGVNYHIGASSIGFGKVSGGSYVEGLALDPTAGSYMTVPGGGASFNGNVIPSTSAARYLGSASLSWAALYLNMPSGAVPFIGTNGLVTEDTSRIFYNPTNKYFGLGTSIPNSALHIKLATPVITLQDINGTNAVYYGNFTDNGQLSINRNPGNNSYNDPTKSAAQISLVSSVGPSSIFFFTTTAVNSIPNNNMILEGNGNLLIGKGTDNGLAKIQDTAGAYFGDSVILNKTSIGTSADSVLVLNNITHAIHKVAQSSISGGTNPPFADNAALVKNNSDNTKLLILSAASIGTGTTRTATFPNSNITVADQGSPLSQFAATTSTQLASVLSDETGTGVSVFNTTPTLITPVFSGLPSQSTAAGTDSVLIVKASGASAKLPVPAAGTAPPFADNAALVKNNSDNTKLLILSAASIGTGTTRTATFPNSNITVADQGSPLSQFAATTSTQLASVLSDETGTGVSVFNTTPTLITPVFSGLPSQSTAAGTDSVLIVKASGASAKLPVPAAGTAPPFADNAALVKNNSDNTKLLILSAASIGTGTTRTATFPNSNITVADQGSPLSQFAATTSTQLASVLSDETGTGVSVFNTTPTLITPVFSGLPSQSTASGTDSVLIVKASGATAKLPVPSGGGASPPFADNAALVKNNADNTKLLILSAASIGTGTTRTATFPNSNITVADQGSPLNQFASTTSSQLASIISDETGTGLAVFNNGPTLNAPLLTGLASAGANDSVLTSDPTTGAVHRKSGKFQLYGGQAIVFTGGDTVNWQGQLTAPDTINTNGFALLITNLPNKATPASTDSILYEDATGKIFKIPSGAGTYTPTFVGVANATSIATLNPWTYMRVGNIVFVEGTVSYSCTITGSTAVNISLPISSTLTGSDINAQSTVVPGTLTNAGTSFTTSGNSLQVSYSAGSSGTNFLTVTFSYIVH